MTCCARSICALSVVLVVAVAAQGGIINPSFEDGLANWTPAGAAGAFTTVGADPLPTIGLLCLNGHLASQQGQNSLQAGLSQKFYIPADATSLSVDVGYSLVNNSSHWARLYILDDLVLGNIIQTIDLLAGAATPLPNSWDRYLSDVGNWQDSPAKIEFGLSVSGELTTKSIWVDNIQFTPEPASALMLVALGGVLPRRRRARSAD
jgi:hypothetical protein